MMKQLIDLKMNDRDRKQICTGLAKVCDLLYKVAIDEAPKRKGRKQALKNAEVFHRKSRVFRALGNLKIQTKAKSCSVENGKEAVPGR